MFNRLSVVLENNSATVANVGLCEDMVNIDKQDVPKNLLDFIFRNKDGNFVNLPEILNRILTSKYCKYDDGSVATDDYKCAHNYCQLFAKTEKMGPKTSKNEYIAMRLKEFIEKEPLESNPIICSHFATVLKSIINSTKGDYLSRHPYFLFPILNHPDHVGFSSILFSILLFCPKFYELTAERAAEFVTFAKETNDKSLYIKSYNLLNTFNSLFAIKQIKKENITLETVKYILDASLKCIKEGKIVFYEGILFISRILPHFDNKHAISRYVKARGKGFYKREGLDDMEIGSDQIITEKLKLFIDTFPVFFAAGINKLYPLLFRMDKPVSSEFNRTFLDYITRMSNAKFNRFITDNKIQELLIKSIPPFPTDKEVMEADENIQYLNPHAILLANYIFDGLPRRECLPPLPEGEEIDPTMIVKNENVVKSLNSKEFSDFMVTKVLPYKQLLFPTG